MICNNRVIKALFLFVVIAVLFMGCASPPRSISSIIIWIIKVGDDVRPGNELTTIQWSQDPDEQLIAPDGCTGEVKDINGNIRYNDLEYPPSQFLARIS